MQLLRKSTAATVRIGPFMGPTNGVTPVTTITLGAADQAEILKETGGTVDISAATWAAITSVAGWYDLSLTTSHTDTLGKLTVIVQDESACLPVFAHFMVIPEAEYDALVAGTIYRRTHAAPFSISGTDLLAKKTDGTTTQFTAALTSGTADPVTGLALGS